MRAKGCNGVTMHRSIEKPQRYWVVVQWETLENHTVDFANSADFQAWRNHVMPYFAARPEVEHTYFVL